MPNAVQRHTSMIIMPCQASQPSSSYQEYKEVGLQIRIAIQRRHNTLNEFLVLSLLVKTTYRPTELREFHENTTQL